MSVLSEAEAASMTAPNVAHVARPLPRKPEIAPRASDPEALLDFLHREGPHTYGAASALGWGATRAWQAEARLRADGLVRHDAQGKVHPVAK